MSDLPDSTGADPASNLPDQTDQTAQGMNLPARQPPVQKPAAKAKKAGGNVPPVDQKAGKNPKVIGKEDRNKPFHLRNRGQEWVAWMTAIIILGGLLYIILAFTRNHADAAFDGTRESTGYMIWGLGGVLLLTYTVFATWYLTHAGFKTPIEEVVLIHNILGSVRPCSPASFHMKLPIVDTVDPIRINVLKKTYVVDQLVTLDNGPQVRVKGQYDCKVGESDEDILRCRGFIDKMPAGEGSESTIERKVKGIAQKAMNMAVREYGKGEEGRNTINAHHEAISNKFKEIMNAHDELKECGQKVTDSSINDIDDPEDVVTSRNELKKFDLTVAKSLTLDSKHKQDAFAVAAASIAGKLTHEEKVVILRNEATGDPRDEETLRRIAAAGEIGDQPGLPGERGHGHGSQKPR